MESVMAVLMFVIFFSILVPTVCVLVVRNRLHHRNRVSPRVRTDAPLGWLWSPAFAARLHRRLQRAAGLARAVVALHQRTGGQARLVEMAQILEREAVALDERLALIGRLHVSQRRLAMPDLLAEVTRIEKVALRLSMQQLDQRVDARLEEQSSAVHQLAIELDALDEAHEVLRKVEADAGLHRPAPARVPTPSPHRSRSRPRPGSSASSGSRPGRSRGAYAAEPPTRRADDRDAGSWPGR